MSKSLGKFPLYWAWMIFVASNGCGLSALVPVGYEAVSKYGFSATMVYMTARGGYAKVTIIEPIHGLGDYTHLTIPQMESGIGEGISTELLRYLDNQIIEEVQKIEFEKPGGKTLVVKGKVIHLTDGLMENYIVARIELLDADTKESLGLANIEGKSEGIHGIKAAAEGVAVGIANLIAGHKGS